MTLLGVDVGDRRVGIALSDERETIASPYGTFPRAQGRAERMIVQLVATLNISQIVVGLPLNEDGSHSEQCLKVENFCRRLAKRVTIPIGYMDEYASSSLALERMQSTKGVRRGKIAKEAIDSASAALILQEFIDRKIT